MSPSSSSRTRRVAVSIDSTRSRVGGTTGSPSVTPLSNHASKSIFMGAPKWPPNPPSLVAPRRRRGAPRSNPPSLVAPRRRRGAPSITVAGYHRLCYAPMARRRAGRPRRASLPRDHRDSQGLEGEVRARQAHGPALARSRAALRRALPGELRLPAADLLRGRRPPRRARARPGAGGATLHPPRAGDRRHDHARRERPGRQGHRRARRRPGVRTLPGHRGAAAAPAQGAGALLSRLQGARAEDRGGRAHPRARRRRAGDQGRGPAVPRYYRPQARSRAGAKSVITGGLVTLDVTIGAILDETTGMKFQSAPASPALRGSHRAGGSMPSECRRLASTTR